jgi:enoyl-CoA hydratase/carnithine racemase
VTLTTVELDAARVLTWDRQARRNAWDLATMTELADALEQAGSDPDVRVVIVRGAGGHFSAGDDLFAAMECDAAAWATTIEAFQRLTRVVLELDVPVVAAMDGSVIGGALEFAASCDVRVGTRRLRLGTPEVTIGLVATNAGTLLLPEVLGETAARDLLLTGAPKDAEWALLHGFLTEIHDDLDEAVDRWAEMFDGTSRAAVARTKRLLNARFGTLLAEAMDRETQACLELFEGPDAPAALQAFADSRRG